MLSFFGLHEKQIFLGNILFVVCCLFYLAWWLLAFKPVGAITGLKTGWLLIPAAGFGIWGVVQVFRGIFAKTPASLLLDGRYILWGGVALYFILLFITITLFKRPATTELVLIVGWAMLALAEANTLFGFGLFSRARAVSFMVLIGIAAIISLACYVLYYRLDRRAGYIDGLVPLLLAGLTMAGISGFMLAAGA